MIFCGWALVFNLLSKNFSYFNFITYLNRSISLHIFVQLHIMGVADISVIITIVNNFGHKTILNQSYTIQ